MHTQNISIYGIYIAPLLRGAPSPGLGENKSFKELVKWAGQIPWKREEEEEHEQEKQQQKDTTIVVNV